MGDWLATDLVGSLNSINLRLVGHYIALELFHSSKLFLEGKDATQVDVRVQNECQLSTCLHGPHALHAEVSKGSVLLFNKGSQSIGLLGKLNTKLIVLLLLLQFLLQGGITCRNCVQHTAPLLIHILEGHTGHAHESGKKRHVVMTSTIGVQYYSI